GDWSSDVCSSDLVMTPRLSRPIVYVPVNACAVSAAPVPAPVVFSLPLVRLPAPSAVNMPTAAEIETVPFPLILSAPAPAGGANVALAGSNAAASVPSSVTVPAGATSATFTVNTSIVVVATSATISATYDNTTLTATLSVLI